MDLQTGAWVESVAPPAAITWLEGLKKSGLSAKVSLANQLVLTQLLGAIAKAPSQAADLALVLGDLLGGLLTTAETHPPFTQSVCFTGLNSDVEAMEKKVQLQENTRECPVFALVVGPGPVRARAAHPYDCSEKQF